MSEDHSDSVMQAIDDCLGALQMYAKVARDNESASNQAIERTMKKQNKKEQPAMATMLKKTTSR